MDRHTRSFFVRPPPFSPLFNRPFFDDWEAERFLHPPSYSTSTASRLGEGGEVVDNEKEFSVSVDVAHFSPDELKVDIVDDELIIEGKHPEKADKNGLVERSFKRRYRLPPNVQPEGITSELTKEGILVVKYDKKPETKPKTINITIQHKN